MVRQQAYQVIVVDLITVATTVHWFDSDNLPPKFSRVVL